MKKEEILKFDGEIINKELFDEIWESEDVDSIESCGESGNYPKHTVYNVKLVDGSDIDIYDEEEFIKTRFELEYITYREQELREYFNENEEEVAKERMQELIKDSEYAYNLPKEKFESFEDGSCVIKSIQLNKITEGEYAVDKFESEKIDFFEFA